MFPWLKEEKPFVPGPIKNAERFEALSKASAKPVRQKFVYEDERPPVERHIPQGPVKNAEKIATLAQPVRQVKKYEERRPRTPEYLTAVERGPYTVPPRVLELCVPPTTTEKHVVKVAKKEEDDKKKHEVITMLPGPRNQEYWDSLSTPLRPLPKVARTPRQQQEEEEDVDVDGAASSSSTSRGAPASAGAAVVDAAGATPRGGQQRVQEKRSMKSPRSPTREAPSSSTSSPKAKGSGPGQQQQQKQKRTGGDTRETEQQTGAISTGGDNSAIGSTDGSEQAS